MSPISVVSLPPEELAAFLMRYRRGETLERYEPRVDHFLCEILSKTNEFVPSASGAIMLDDPRAKMFGNPVNQLTVVIAFGEQAATMRGLKTGCDQGVAGQVYASGRSLSWAGTPEQKFLDERGVPFGPEVRSLLGVPVLLGDSVCGVLLLMNRLDRPRYSEEEHTLIKIFAGYIASSVQNVLDGIRAKELARRDDLTGLFNDRYLHYRLREEIAQADASGADLGLLFLDLDRFKDVNDRHGHLEGSRVLHQIGLLLSHEAPERAVVARYGGDEFVLILPGRNSVRTAEVAEHLRQVVEAADLSEQRGTVEGPIGISASLGVASLREHVTQGGSVAQRANTLIRMADTAMYRAKAEGRNRVVLALFKTKEYPIATPSRREPPNAPDRGAAQPGRGPDPEPAGDLPGAASALRNDSGHGGSG